MRVDMRKSKLSKHGVEHHCFKTTLSVEVEVEFAHYSGRYATMSSDENPAEAEYDIRSLKIVCDEKLVDIKEAVSNDNELSSELQFLCAEHVGIKHAERDAEKEYYNPKKGEIV